MRNRFYVAVALAGLLVAPSASAGPYGDDLSKCLIKATSPTDKEGLVQWMFFAISLNPNAAPFASISTEQREVADKGMAHLLQRLLTQGCVAEARSAVQYEGEESIKLSFKLLGEVAAAEMFNDTNVSTGSQAFVKYLDAAALGEALGLGGKTP